MNRLLFLIVILIIYGSLYPFKFSGQIPDLSQTWDFFSNYSLRTTRSDIIANIILFIPYGFVVRVCLNQYRQRIKGALLLFCFAVVLAYTLQYLQFFLPARVADASDAVYNLLGVILGMIVSHLLIQYSHNHIPQRDRHQTSWSQVSIPLLLALLWVCYRWFPFIPLAATESIIASLNPIINRPELDLFIILRDGISWLIFFFLLSQPPFDKQPRFRVLKIAALILMVELFIINNQITVNDLLAMLSAFAIYASLDFKAIKSSLGWSLLFAMLFTWLTPPDGDVLVRGMNWIPFSSYLQSNPWLETEQILLKLYLIGTLIFVLKNQWFEYRMATLVSFVFVFLLTIIQSFIAIYRPDITDAIAVLFLGWAMFSIDKQASEERTLAMK